MEARDNSSPATPTIDAVRAFWESNPLYTGEASHPPGSAEFFKAHETVTLFEHSGRLHSIFLEDLRPGLRVLDVGCGIGFWVVQFARLGVRMSACDLTDSACRLTQQRLQFEGLSAEIKVGNAEALPYPDASFAHVNCQGVIHHTPDTLRCLAEFNRVLVPGGTACFSVYFRPWALRSRGLYRLATSVAGRLMVLRGRGRERMFQAPNPDEFVRMYDGAGNPIGRAYTRAQIRVMAGQYFTILEETRIGFPRRVLPFGMPDWLHARLSRVFGLMIVLRCRKRETAASGVS